MFKNNPNRNKLGLIRWLKPDEADQLLKKENSERIKTDLGIEKNKNFFSRWFYKKAYFADKKEEERQERDPDYRAFKRR